MPPTRTAVIDDRDFSVRNLNKVLFPADGFTKAHLIEYYLAVIDVILAHLKDRPLVFTRYPDGIDGDWFYQKDLMAGAPDWVQTFPYETKDRTIDFCLCPDRGTLGWIASQACIEIHPWMSRTGSVPYPDFAAFDLDPAEPAGFDDAKEAAIRIRSLLGELGIEPLLKTSGATGLHLYVPIAPKHSYEQTRQFVKEVADIMLQRHPDLITLERPVKNRTGKVYIDYLQIYLGKTLTGPYSVRPRPGAPVSTPLRWEELDRATPAQFTIATVPARIADRGDLFAGALAGRLQLPQVRRWRT